MEKATNQHNLAVSLNNFNISYDDVGEGSIPIIFLHGFPFDKSMWHLQLEFLKTSRRCIAYDIRGFGKSTDEQSSLSIDQFSDDLIVFMEKLFIEKAIVCGLSMGGYIALNALKKYPNRFDALILCDTQCIADSKEAFEKRHKTIAEIEMEGAGNFNERFIQSVFHKDSFSTKTEIVANLKSVVFSNSQHIIIQGLIALAGRSETCSTLSAINIPTLIMCGKEDEITPLVQSEFMHRNIKGSILRVIDDAGHVSSLEQSETFNNHLLVFLDEFQKTSI